MRALALFEAKRLFRSPLLWLGAALTGTFAWLNVADYWPVVTLDVQFAYVGSPAIGAFAALAGGWLGLRDRRHHTASLMDSTPAAQLGSLVIGRLAALALATLVSAIVIFGVVALVSLARGGHGTPDVRFALDAGVFVAGASFLGFLIGLVTGSRAITLLVAPAFPAFCAFVLGQMNYDRADVWLLPHVPVPEWTGPFGYLPDVFTVHLLYMTGLLVALGAGATLIANRGRLLRRVSVMTATTLFVGLAFAVPAAAWLSDQPRFVEVIGPDPSTWVEVDGTNDDYRKAARMQRRHGPYPDDGSASVCVTVENSKACVLPEFGENYARELARGLAELGPLTDLPGFPSKIRMVPSTGYGGGCPLEGEMLYSPERMYNEYVAGEVFPCMLYGPRGLGSPAKTVVIEWYYVEIAEFSTDTHLKGRMGDLARFMTTLSREEIATRLAPVWDDLRTRKLSLDELAKALEAPAST